MSKGNQMVESDAVKSVNAAVKKLGARVEGVSHLLHGAGSVARACEATGMISDEELCAVGSIDVFLYHLGPDPVTVVRLGEASGSVLSPWGDLVGWLGYDRAAWEIGSRVLEAQGIETPKT